MFGDNVIDLVIMEVVKLVMFYIIDFGDVMLIDVIRRSNVRVSCG